MTARSGVVVLTLISGSAFAQPAKDAPEACVNREKTEWRQVRDASVDAKTLRFCTGDDCWSYDRVSKDVTAIAKLPVGPKPSPGGTVALGPDGKPIATASETHAEFCSAPGTCIGFDYKLANPAVNGVFVEINDNRTLGALIARAETEAGKKSTVITFDLAAGKQLKQLAASDVDVLPHGFLIGDDALYDAKMNKVGTLAAADGAWAKIGATDVVALHDKKHGKLILQDLSSGKVVSKIDLGATDPTEWWTYAVAPDGLRLYAIGSAQDEGRILAIDTTNHQIVERTTPKPCASGTHRAN